MLLTRLLTPLEVGAYFLTLSLVTAASIVAQLGLNHTVVRLVAESLSLNQPGRARMVVRYSLYLATLGILVVNTILYLGLGEWLAMTLFESPLMVKIMWVALLWIAVTAFQTLCSEILRGFSDIRLAAVFGGLITSVLAALLLAMVWVWQGRSDLEQAAVLSIGACVASILVAGFFIEAKTRQLGTEGQLNIKEMLLISWPLLVIAITYFIHSQVDIWILGIFHTQEAVAIYGTSARMTLLISIPIMVVNAVVMPVIADMYAKDMKLELERVLQAAAALAMIPAVLVFIGFAIIGGPLLAMMFGEFYRDGLSVLIMLSLGQIATISVGSAGYALMMTGHQNLMMYITLAASIITIGLGLVLVRPYGATGVASASAAGLLVQAVAMCISVKKTIGIWTYVNFRQLPSLRSLLYIR